MSIAQNFPNIVPSLSLDFARVKKLDPRVTFSRASTARYYDGRSVAKAEENLLTYSQEIDSPNWIKSGVTVTGNNATAPDGTLTADTASYASGGAGDNLRRSFNFTAGVTYTISIYVRSVSGDTNFSIDLQNAETQTSTITGSWARYTFTTTPAANRTWLDFQLGATGVIELWGAQIEIRDSVTAYTPTTTQPITNYIPVLQTASANVARFDHDPVTGESLGLLVEEQRTNLLTYSEDFSNAAWQKAKTTVTPNVAVAPDGTLTGDKLVLSVSTSGGTRVQQIVSTSSTTYTVSYKIKYAGRRYIVIGLYNSTSNNAGAGFDLIDGTVTGLSSIGAGYASSNASITPIGNGWYSCSVTVTVGTSTANACPIYFSPTAFLGGVETIYQEDTTGDGYSGIYIWGAQLEAGAFPTSYIPTVASQVTRSADSASMTGTNFSEWYRADSSTFYYDFADGNVSSHAGSAPYDTLIGAVTNGARGGSQNSLVFNSGWKAQSRFTPDISASIINTGGSITTTISSTLKIATFLDQTAMGGSGNGGTVVTTSFTVPPSYPPNMLYINGQLNGHIKKIAYYPLRLSNANLQALTGS